MFDASAQTAATLQHHLQAFGDGVDSILTDYTEGSVLIAPNATFRGLGAIRRFFTAFVEGLPEGFLEAFDLLRQEVSGEVAYIVWAAKPWIPLGTDTFLVRDGKIAVQTVAVHKGAV